VTREQFGTLNLVFAVIILVAALGLLLFGSNKTVGIALLPVAFANLTIGVVNRKKSNG
jgi:hypothetical protein